MYNAGSLVLNYTTSYNATSLTVAFYHCSVPSNKGFPSSTVAIIYYILGFLVPLVVIIIAYSNIYVFLRRKSRNRMINQAALKSTGKALRMLVLMVLGFVVNNNNNALLALTLTTKRHIYMASDKLQ